MLRRSGNTQGFLHFANCAEGGGVARCQRIAQQGEEGHEGEGEEGEAGSRRERAARWGHRTLARAWRGLIRHFGLGWRGHGAGVARACPVTPAVPAGGDGVLGKPAPQATLRKPVGYRCCRLSSGVVQNYPESYEVARSRTELPAVARSCLELPGVARGCPELHGVARSRTELPGVDRSCPESHGVARSRTELPGVARSRPELPGVARSRPESPGVARSRPESTGVDRSRPESPGVDRSRPESTGVDLNRTELAEVTLSPRLCFMIRMLAQGEQEGGAWRGRGADAKRLRFWHEWRGYGAGISCSPRGCAAASCRIHRAIGCVDPRRHWQLEFT
eukprot:gene7908-biopygen9114